jgi:hypothetical protein
MNGGGARFWLQCVRGDFVRGMERDRLNAWCSRSLEPLLYQSSVAGWVTSHGAGLLRGRGFAPGGREAHRGPFQFNRRLSTWWLIWWSTHRKDIQSWALSLRQQMRKVKKKVGELESDIDAIRQIFTLSFKQIPIMMKNFFNSLGEILYLKIRRFRHTLKLSKWRIWPWTWSWFTFQQNIPF